MVFRLAIVEDESKTAICYKATSIIFYRELSG